MCVHGFVDGYSFIHSLLSSYPKLLSLICLFLLCPLPAQVTGQRDSSEEDLNNRFEDKRETFNTICELFAELLFAIHCFPNLLHPQSNFHAEDHPKEFALLVIQMKALTLSLSHFLLSIFYLSSHCFITHSNYSPNRTKQSRVLAQTV